MDSQPMSFGYFAERALLWTFMGRLAGLQGARLAQCAFIGPMGERVLGVTLEDLLTAIEQGERAMERQEKRRQSLEALAAAERRLAPPTIKTIEIVPSLDGQTIGVNKDGKWLEVIPHPSVVLILGRRGSGKSALGYRLLELFRFRSLPFALGMPRQGQKLVPEWLGIINDPSEAPQDSTVLVDEAHLQFHARESQKPGNREISRILNLSRQRQQTLIFVSQQARYLDKNVASAADVLVIKEPEPLQPKFERPEINEIVKIAGEKFRELTGSKKEWSLVYSPVANFFELLSNDLPSYWSSWLSRVYGSSASVAPTKPARRVTREEKVRRAKQLARMGISVSQITRELGVSSRTTVYTYLATPEPGVQSR